MVEKNQNYYCPSMRKMDPTILAEKPWWDTIHSGSQTPSDLTKEWYSEFQDGYESLTEQEASTS